MLRPSTKASATLAVIAIVAASVWAGAPNANDRSVRIARGKSMASSATATATVALAITSVIRRGEVVELKGRTERGASVMINGERVPVVRPDGTFVFFFLVPDGPYAVSVTAQNSLGAVRTLRHPIE